jgi:hypothetical protein
MVAACALVAALAAILIKSPRVMAVAAILAGLGAGATTWSVLHDTHSTAALGVIAPPVIGMLVFGITLALDTGRQPPPGAGWRA